jgi:hypothetical protein
MYELLLCAVLAFGQLPLALAAPADGLTNASKQIAAGKRQGRKRPQDARRRHRRSASKQRQAKAQANSSMQERVRPAVDSQPAEEAPNLQDYPLGDPRANQPREYKPPIRRDRPKRYNP